MSTILIIDDVQTDRELLGSVVTKAGHRPLPPVPRPGIANGASRETGPVSCVSLWNRSVRSALAIV